MVPGAEATQAVKLIRLPAVMNLTTLGKSSIYNKVKEGDFPAPVRLSTRAVAWRCEDVEEWVSSRVKVNAQPAQP